MEKPEQRKIISIGIALKPGVRSKSMPYTGTLLSLERAMTKFKEKYPEYDFTDINPLTSGLIVRHSDVTSARTQIYNKFVGTHLFIIGSDHTIDEDALIKLFEADKLVVDAPTVKKKFPYEPAFGWIKKNASIRWAVYNYDYDAQDIIGNSIIPVDVTGGCAILIKREVFDMVDCDVFGHLHERIRHRVKPELFYSHDISFSMRLKAAGIQPYMHMGIRCEHDTEMGYRWLDSHVQVLEQTFEYRHYFDDEIEDCNLILREEQRKREKDAAKS